MVESAPESLWLLVFWVNVHLGVFQQHGPVPWKRPVGGKWSGPTNPYLMRCIVYTLLTIEMLNL